MRIITASLLLAAGVSSAALAADPSSDTVLVKRGDVEVTVADFNAAMARVPESERFDFRASLERVKKMVDGLYIARMLARDARAEGLDKDPEIHNRIALQEEQLLAAAYIEKFEKSIKTPDFEQRAKELYLSDPKKYTLPERVKLHYIFVDNQGRTPQEVLNRATEARKRLLADENFFAVAKEYSNDPSYRATQGEIGPAKYDELPAQVAAVARKMSKAGEVSDLIEMPQGYAIVQFVQHIPPETVPFDKAKKDLVKAEQNKFKREAMDRKFGEITARKDVIVYTDNIAALKTEPDQNKIRELHEEAAGRAAKK